MDRLCGSIGLLRDPGQLPIRGRSAENRKQAVDGLGRLCEYAERLRPSGHRTARTELQDPDWILSVIKELNHSHAGILPDFNNFGTYDRYDAVRKTLPHAPAVAARH